MIHILNQGYIGGIINLDNNYTENSSDGGFSDEEANPSNDQEDEAKEDSNGDYEENPKEDLIESPLGITED